MEEKGGGQMRGTMTEQLVALRRQGLEYKMIAEQCGLPYYQVYRTITAALTPAEQKEIAAQAPLLLGRKMAKMRAEEHLSYRQIADYFGVSIPYVRNHVEKARREDE